MARMVQCIKLNKEAEGLDFAPLPGELGKKFGIKFLKKRGQDGLSSRLCSSMKIV